MSKIVPTTSLNSAIKRIANGDTGAASVIAMLNSQCPQNIMDYLRVLDERMVYGQAVYSFFHDDCNGNLDELVKALSER
jgi:hypothetical protein